MKQEWIKNGFGQESELRQWVREETNDQCYWIEPAMGSTLGLPDCIVPWVARVPVFFELKLSEPLKANGQIRYEVRPDQKKVVRDMRDRGLICGILLAIHGTKDVAVLPPHDQVIAGRPGIIADWTVARDVVWLAKGDWKQHPNKVNGFGAIDAGSWFLNEWRRTWLPI